MQIHERAAPLQTLVERFATARGGQGSCIVVQGEAGIGKTTLLRSFFETLPGDARVLRGACEDLSIAEPLGPLWDLAREAGWQLDADLGGSGGRLSAFTEVLSSISALPVPTVILVEDIHWADIATVDFLKFLARRLDDRRLMLVVTARTDDPRGRTNIRHMLSGVSPDHVTRIDLQPLSKDAVVKLAEGTGLDANTLFSVTNGNARMRFWPGSSPWAARRAAWRKRPLSFPGVPKPASCLRSLAPTQKMPSKSAC